MNQSVDTTVVLAPGVFVDDLLSLAGDRITYLTTFPNAGDFFFVRSGASTRVVMGDDSGRTVFDEDGQTTRELQVFARPGTWTTTLTALSDGVVTRLGFAPADLTPVSITADHSETVAFTEGAGRVRRNLVVTSPTRITVRATDATERARLTVADVDGRILVSNDVVRQPLLRAFDLEPGTTTFRLDLEVASALSTDVLFEVFAPGDGELTVDRVWTDLQADQAQERVVVPFEVSEGERIEIALGLAGAGSAGWVLEDPWGQEISSAGSFTRAKTVGPYTLGAGTYRFVLDAGDSGLSRADLRIGRNLPGDLVGYYSRNNAGRLVDLGRATIFQFNYAFGPSGIELGVREPVASYAGWADGMVLAPDGDLLVSGLNTDFAYKLDPFTGLSQSRHVLTEATVMHAGVLPDGRTGWITGGRISAGGPTSPGQLFEAPLFPFGTPTEIELSGDNRFVTTLAFDGSGAGFYTTGGASADFGRIDLDTATTTRIHTDVEGMRSALYDPHSDRIVTVGGATVNVIRPSDGGIETSFSVGETGSWDGYGFVAPADRTAVIFDQGEAVGDGQLLFADNLGQLIYFDYRDTGSLTASSAREIAFLDIGLDDVIPSTNALSSCEGVPQVADLSPPSGLLWESGTPVLVSGYLQPLAPTRAVAEVTVGGVQATLDTDGRFFASVPVASGLQSFEVVATERCGAFSVGSVSIEGVDGASLSGDFVDVSALVSSSFDKTLWETDLLNLTTTLVGTNQATIDVQGPLRLVLTERAGDDISFTAPDGSGPFGPYLNVLPSGATLAAGTETAPFTLGLSNPLRRPLVDTVRWLTAGNLPPRFVSVPDVDARADEAWSYDADAVDPNGDALTYSLISAPQGMTLSATGLASWTPTPADVGVHTVEVQAADTFGGTATQRFSLVVRVGALNSPPSFVSTPLVLIDSGTSYTYDADAADVDNDTLAYSLLDGPPGAAVDLNSGEVTWPGDVDGLYTFSIGVSDGQGGSATQAWTLGVGVSTNPSAPVIVSNPTLTVGSGDLYVYPAAATDADNDVLSWSILAGPVDLILDTATGRLQWLTSRGAPGSYPVQIAVSDGTHAATQSWVLEVTDGPSNAAPVFLTSPFKQAVVGIEYAYDALAEDPEAYDVTYALTAGPAGMTVDATTGEVRWTPASVPAGNTATAIVSAADPQGNGTAQSFLITVAATNEPPTLDVGTPMTVVAIEPWSHAVFGADPDGFAVTYSLVSGPPGMFIDATTGVLTWTALASDAGVQTAVVRVTDLHGLTAEGTLNLNVELDTSAPGVDLVLTQGRFCPGVTAAFCVTATDDQSIASVALQQDGLEQTLDSHGCLSLTLTEGATTTFDAFVTDRTGNVGTASRTIEVDECDITVPFPTLTITTPDEGVRVVEPTTVVADIVPSAGADIVFWDARLYPAEGDEDAGVLIGTGTSAPVGGVVGDIDPTLLANGLWMVRVRAADSGDPLTAGTDYAGFEVGGDFKPGRFVLAFEDMTVDIPRAPVRMVRRYDTLDAHESTDFGFGWDLDIESIKIQTNGPLGRGGWSSVTCDSAFVFPYRCPTQRFPHFALVTWPNGDTELFDMAPPQSPGFIVTSVAPVFEGRERATSTLRAAPGYDAPGAIINDADDNLYNVLEGQTGGFWDVKRFELTDIAGTTYTIDKVDGLVQIRDRFDNTTDFREDGIVSSLGADTTYERDGQGRITGVVDPIGKRITYTYDAAGDLVQMTDRNGDSMDYVYDDAHRLLSYNIEGEDPIGVQVYGPDGRLESSIGSQGEHVDQTSDTGALVITEVGPDPGLTTTMQYDERGRVLSSVQDFVDPQGVAQSYVTELTYNDRDLLETRTLPTGAVTSYVYDDQERVTSQVDADGVTRETDYGAFSQVSERREGGELLERTEFGALDLPVRVFRGDNTKLREVGYDAFGRPQAMESGTGEVMTMTYEDGQMSTVTLPPYNGQPDILNIDMNDRGELLSVSKVFPDGTGVTQYEYDGEGRRATIVDPRGGRMSFTYDLLGRMETYTDKLGKTKFYTFDADGRELTMTNRNGEVLTRTYDEAGRLATMVGPGVDRELRYDALGRRVYGREGNHVVETMYDEHGVTGEHVYGLVAGEHVDATWVTSHDDAGRLVDLIGPIVGGDTAMTTSHGYDDRGRLETITEAALGAFTYGYDGASRQQTLTRPNGMVTTTSYDDGGRTTAMVTELLGDEIHSITTTYDDRGIPATQTDQEGTHVYEHDQRGRLVGVDHPDGAAFGDESYEYDQAERRVASHRDAASQLVFDDGDRLVQDATYAYQYDDEGRRVGRTHRVSGVQTTYGYTILDQLILVEEGTDVWEYGYTCLNLRARAVYTVSGGPSYHEEIVFDLSGAVRGQYDVQSNTERAFVVGPHFGEVLAERTGAIALNDRLNTTTGWVHDGMLTYSVRDTYGRRQAPSDRSEAFGYTGHLEDPTGLTWGRARMLDTEVGGWTSEDPVSVFSRYQYVDGRITTFIDPTGASEVGIYSIKVSGSGGSTTATANVSRAAMERFLVGLMDGDKIVLLVAPAGPGSIKVIELVNKHNQAVALLKELGFRWSNRGF